MAFPTTGTIDNFNRIENPLSDGGKWTTYLSDLQTDGADCANVTAGSPSGAYRNDQNYGPDSESWAVVSDPGDVTGTPGNISLAVRWDTAANNCYIVDCPRFRTTADEFRLKEVTGGVETQLGASITQDVAAGDSVGVEIIGTTLAAYYKSGAGVWTQLGTRTPSTSYPSAGRVGIFDSHNVGAVPEPKLGLFGGGTVVAAGTVDELSAGRRLPVLGMP